MLDEQREKDLKMLTRNLNAKIGAHNSGYGQDISEHGLGEMNENGELPADLCAFNNMVIGCSTFPHKDIRKTTWKSPYHVTQNQIDHVCIGQKFRRLLQDARVKTSADELSDHHLVMSTRKLLK